VLNDDPVIKNRMKVLNRNKAIKKDFQALKEKGIKSSRIWELLAAKYYTSVPNIKKIIYMLED